MFSMYGRIYPIDYVSLTKVMYRAYSNIEVWCATAAWFNLVFVVLFFINLYRTFVHYIKIVYADIIKRCYVGKHEDIESNSPGICLILSC